MRFTIGLVYFYNFAPEIWQFFGKSPINFRNLKRKSMRKIFQTTYNQAYLDLILLFGRIAISCMMLTHGLPKMQELMAGNYEFADPIGLGMKTSLILAVFTEVILSIFMIIGFAFRLSTFGLLVTMIIAAFVTHGGDAFAVKEKAILYLLVYAVLAVTGSGKYAVDYFISKKLND